MIAGRPDWCLSRQRIWGVPIPVLYCEDCNAPFVSPSHMQAVADQVELHGAKVWGQRSVAELFGEVQCGSCGGQRMRKEQDILDVWFDSGVSFAAVIGARGMGQPEGVPIDLYLEGSDQHRGWFHSALLCSVATTERPPYRAVLTHGFVVDGQGKKISKSKGNFIDPFKAIDRDGVELIRLWAASEDYRDDVRLSPVIMTRLTDTYRKLRNTIRYLLGNLAGFVPERDLLAVAQLWEVDRYALALMQRQGARIQQAYAGYQFHQAVQGLTDLCNLELSAFYLDMLKDRLYAAGAADPGRHSARSVLYLLARDILRLLAPVCCFTAEEAWQQLPRWPTDPGSVHLMHHPGQQEPAPIAAIRAAIDDQAPQLLAQYEHVRALRRQVNAALEAARRAKLLGASTTAQVRLSGPCGGLGAVHALAAAGFGGLSHRLGRGLQPDRRRRHGPADRGRPRGGGQVPALLAVPWRSGLEIVPSPSVWPLSAGHRGDCLMPQKPPGAPNWCYAMIASMVLVHDQASKMWAVGYLTQACRDGAGVRLGLSACLQQFLWTTHPVPSVPVTILPNFWHFRYVENPGAAWGFLAGSASAWRTPFFLCISLTAMVFLLRYFASTTRDQLQLRFALALVFGGAVGNFLDRVRLGYVIDFIDWHWYNAATWPTFNVADAAITVGVGMLFIDMFASKPRSA